MNKWPLIPLGDVVDDILDRRGVTPTKLGSQFQPVGHRVISAKVIKEGRIDLSADEPRFVDRSTYRRWMRSPLRADDVLLTSEAPLGEVAYVAHEADWCLGQRLFAVRTAKRRLSGRFLYYLLRSGSTRDELLARATGTTVQGIRQSELRRVRIPLPSLETQFAIAESLGTLDDKLELNRNIAETLEAVIRALFRSWFGRVSPDDSTLPSGWSAGTLADVAVSLRRSVRAERIEPSTPYVGLEHLPRRSITLLEWDHAGGVASGKLAFEQGEILFGKLRPYFHKVVVAPTAGVCSTDIVVLRPRSPEWFGFVLGVVSGNAFVDYTSSGSTGTRMPRTSWDQMAQYKVALPPFALASSFSRAVRPIIERLMGVVHECGTLSTLRDGLLPELLSGRLRVM